MPPSLDGLKGLLFLLVRPQKVALKKIKSCAKFVAEVAQKSRKSCAKVARNFAHF